MKFHGVMILRNEEDVIEECLTSLLQWIDAVYILDLGSSDSTWQIIQRMAESDSRIVPFEQRPYIFSNALRGYVFEQFRSRFSPGDWVLRVDADEFYEMPPPQFVKHCLRPHETCVYLQWYYFRLTSLDVARYESGTPTIAEDRKQSILLRRRHYKMPLYSEPRMFQYRKSIKWRTDSSFPTLAGRIAQKRIPIRHYPHRDPLQMQARYALRYQTYRNSSSKSEMSHWGTDDWRADLLNYDDQTGQFHEASQGNSGLTAAPEHTSGATLEWMPGEPLPPTDFRSHLPQGKRQLAQKILYPHLARLLDPFQAGWPEGYVPPLEDSGFSSHSASSAAFMS